MTLRSTAWRMAWREARAALPKFIFVAFGVAVGVGALTGVRGFSSAFHEALQREARTLIAADLTVRQFSAATDAQRAALQRWEKRGVRTTGIIETVSMMSVAPSSPGAPQALVSIKAVDPALYPFYGKVRLEPEQELSKALEGNRITVSDDLLPRLNLEIGSTVHLGAADFTVAGVTRFEPDRITGSSNFGSRILMSRAGLERTGLITFGSMAAHRTLFQLPAQGVDVAEVRAALKKDFPDALVADFREGHPYLNRALERSTRFLSLVSLIALILGALGVATAIASHIQQRLDSIATLKCLGARSWQIIRIYTLQTMLLGLAGGLAGIVVGATVQKLFPLLLTKYIQIQNIHWSGAFALEGIAAGMLVTLLFTLPPLLAIRRVKPALILRREMAEAKPPLRDRLKEQLPAMGAGAVILAGLGAIAGWLSDSLQMGAYFIGGLTVALLILALVAWLLLLGVKLLLRWAPRDLPIALRHGMANLYRPGSHATSILVALGIGVMFTLTIYLVQKSLLVEVAGAAPPGAPNVFLINISQRDHDAVEEFLKSRKEAQGKPRLVPQVPLRLLAVDGTPVEKRKSGEAAEHPEHTRQVTWVEDKPEDIRTVKGAWWKPGEPAALVSVPERTAQSLQIEPGSTLRWRCVDKEFDVKVAAIHSVEGVRGGPDGGYLFNKAALEPYPTQWYGAIRLPPAKVSGFQRDTFSRFPTITAINAADVMSIVQEVVDQVAIVIRFISAFAILAGAIILASTVAGTRLRRTREVAVLKTLGARRRRLVAIFSAEFAILGGVAGLMGGALATVFSRLLMLRLLDAKFRFEALPNVVTVVLTLALAVATGWAASWKILNRRPLDVLRGE
jgi:putative ABC transport system permease protein